MRIRTRRIYEGPEASDGRRILIDRLWLRGRTVTIVFGSKEQRQNNATALREYLESRSG